jgi:hypothetical protein
MHVELRPRRMAAVLALAVLAGACAADEDPAGPGTPGEGSISAVAPLEAFLDRSTTFLVSGSGTAWGASATADFGAGTSVTSSTATASAISGVLAIDGDVATTGPRTVSVMDAGETWTLPGAFSIEAPLAVDSVWGSIAQGGFAIAHVRMLDSETPFDVSGGASIRTRVEGGAVTVGANGLTEFSLQAGAFIDVNASTGPTAVIVESGPEGSAVLSRSEPVLDVQARTPASLAAGASSSGPLTDPLESAVYAVTTSTNQVVTVSTTSTGSVVVPVVSGPDSTYRELISAENVTFFAPAGEAWFVTLLNFSGSPTDFDLTTDTASVTPVVYSGPVAGSVGVGGYDVYAVPALAGQTIVATISASGGSTCAENDLDAEMSLSGASQFVYADLPFFCPTLEFEASADATYYLLVKPWVGCPSCSFAYALEVQVS